MRSCAALIVLIGVPLLATAQRADILIADFEGPDYGDWKVEGQAFGSKPATGTLPNQMPVSGFLGKGLVNSYAGGDASTGTLTSPAFKIERKYINFLIGGGQHPGETCINLVIGDKVVRTATGPNAKPGGSEQLDWHSWDVGELMGKMATIQIVDEHKGGWGHINIDQIVQSDQKKMPSGPAQREIAVQQKYLHLPIKTGAPMQRMKLSDGGILTQEFEIELAPAAPDFWVFVDVSKFKGRKLTVGVDRLPADSQALMAITQADEVPDAANMYQEKHRPQFHFTSRRGWLNDPNGLVYYQGEYHLFYQHNPYGWNWGNMHWGHAVSKDLVHWQELPIALYPPKFGDWCFSGSATVDAKNTGGFKTGAGPALVAAFTSTGRGECIVYSNDAGRSWHEFAGNPVVKHTGRDPKLLWHEPSKAWVMAVYDEANQGKDIAFYTSPDLKKWTYQSRIKGFFECPDFFEMPVDGDVKKTKWVLYAADGQYVLGHFDGKSFHQESGKHRLWHGNFYAAQTFDHAPNGRRIQIGWGQGITFPGMPFNQQMTFPVELTLRSTADAPRLFAEPVKEIAGLHKKKHHWHDLALADTEHLLKDVAADLMQIKADFDTGKAAKIEFTVRGIPIKYDGKKKELSVRGLTAALPPTGGKVQLEMLIDRGSIEVFANGGRIAFSSGGITATDQKSISIRVAGTSVFQTLSVFELASAWPQPK